MFATVYSEWKHHPERAHLKIIDLGLATVYSPSTLRNGVLGSPGYVAPEVIEGGAHTPAMDMFSLGVMLFVMLAGCKPMTPHQECELDYSGLEAHQYAGCSGAGFLVRAHVLPDGCLHSEL